LCVDKDWKVFCMHTVFNLGICLTRYRMNIHMVTNLILTLTHTQTRRTRTYTYTLCVTYLTFSLRLFCCTITFCHRLNTVCIQNTFQSLSTHKHIYIHTYIHTMHIHVYTHIHTHQHQQHMTQKKTHTITHHIVNTPKQTYNNKT